MLDVQVDFAAGSMFDPAGKFVRSFGNEYSAFNIHTVGHGIDIRKEGNTEYLYLCHTWAGLVTKTTLKGEIVWALSTPWESGVYKDPKQFIPTNVAFHPTDGSFYIADGYGTGYIHRYSNVGKYMSTFGGSGGRDQHGKFQTPHGLWVDNRPGREAQLCICDRANARLEYFTLDGKYVSTVEGLSYPAHLDIRGDVMLCPDLHARVTLFDKDNKVILDNPNTLAALEYAKELYANFIPGTLSWLDPNNNKAFLDGQISATNNGISVYYAAKNSADPKVKEMAADINHAPLPIGPAGVPTEYHLFFNQMVMKYTKYPQAAKAFLQFMMEAEQFNPWLQGGGGYVSHPLKAFDTNPIWTSDPKHTAYRDSFKNLRPAGFPGRLGYASAGVLADFIVPNMVAEAASGAKTPKEAAERAQKRAERYYKV